MASPHNATVASRLPSPWERPASLQETLYEWLEKAPWLGISLCLHLLIYFFLAAIPWSDLREEPSVMILAAAEAPEQLFPELPPEVLLPDETPTPLDLPRLLELPTLSDMHEPSELDLMRGSLGRPEASIHSPRLSGLGPGAWGGPMSGRGQRGPGLRQRGTQKPLTDALEWLAMHQDPDGSWSAENFDERCGAIGTGSCSGAGNPAHDVGVTGLALLAFLGNGDTPNQGTYRETVRRGVHYLNAQQDHDSGLIGPSSSRDFLYDHAIASLALAEAYYFSRNPLAQRYVQKAIDYIARARNPYGAWRYGVPPEGDNDTSVSGWMLFALKAAKEAHLAVDREALADGLAWIDQVTTPKSGQVGYDARGSASSRTPSNEHFPRDKGEAMTAVGLLCRIFLGQDPAETKLEGQRIMQNGADLLLTKLPEWDAEGFGCDMYYWYYGTYAMFQMGGRHWKRWNAAMQSTLLPHQQQSGDAKGSWDPVGPWGKSGGRVYSTALMALCLEVYFRYGNLLGAR